MEQINQPTNQRTKERKNEGKSERTSERTNQPTYKPTNKCDWPTSPDGRSLVMSMVALIDPSPPPSIPAWTWWPVPSLQQFILMIDDVNITMPCLPRFL